MPRRTGLRAALSAVAATAAGSALSVPVRAAATRGSGKVQILLQVSWQGGVNYQGTVQALTDAFLQRYWVSQHPGVELTTQAGSGSNGNSTTSAATIAAVIAGEGPDVIVGCCQDVPSYQVAGVLADLTPWLKRDNVDITSIFPASTLDVLSTDQGVFGLPDYGSTGPLYIHQTMLDDLGIAYPEPDWTYEDAAKLWRAIAGRRNGKQVYGAGMVFDDSDQEWLPRGWGGQVYDPTHTRCLLNSALSLEAYNWMVPLMVANVVYPGTLAGATPLQDGEAAFSVACCGSLQSAVLDLGDNIKWDIVPMPTFPMGKTDFNGIGMYGMNAFSKNSPELIWDLMQFVCIGAPWQEYFNARLAFMPPNSTDAEAWDDWMTIARSVAPVLRDKHLEYYAQALPGAYNRAYFRYAPLEADAILSKYTALMASGRMTPVDALDQVAGQINALEGAGAGEAGIAAQATLKVRSELAQAARASGAVTFAAPARSGEGKAYGSAGKLVAAAAGGAWRVTGYGSMGGGEADVGTFACGAVLSSRGSFGCRIASVAALSHQTLQGGAKVGLMARGDLSDSAPVVFVDLDGPNGIHVDDRPIGGVVQAHQHAGSGGLLSGSGLVSTSSSPIANSLLKPIWLRLVRADSTWTAYTSLDGVHWAQAGTPVTEVQMAGCWVGLFVDCKNTPYGVEAVFDHVTGFAPDTFVVLGGG